jgi:hypothetical protein
VLIGTFLNAGQSATVAERFAERQFSGLYRPDQRCQPGDRGPRRLTGRSKTWKDA